MPGPNMPLYMQLASYVCRRLLSGDWKAADALPDLRSLAAGFEVNTHIAEKTRELLRRYEIVREGSEGYVFSPSAHESARQLLRDDFIERYIPYLSEQLQVLGITPEELARMIQNHKLQPQL